MTTQELTKADSRELSPAARLNSVRTFFESNQASIEKAMPRIGITPEHLLKTAIMAISKNAALLDCDRMSLFRATVEAAQLGLTFALGRAYLVPYWNKKKSINEAQLIPGYMGLADLARRSGEVRSIAYAAVYEGDEFEFSFGLTEDHLRHKPLTEPDDAKLTHAWCVVRLKDGGYQFRVMTRKQVESVRARSKSKDNGPWVTDFEAMALKTVIKRTLKLCPMSIEMQRAVELDDRADLGKGQVLGSDQLGDYLDGVEIGDDDTEDGTEPKATRTESVKERIRAVKGGAAVETTAHATVDPLVVKQIETGLLSLSDGNAADAEVLLSEITGGKLRDLTKLGAQLTPELEEQIRKGLIAKDKESGGAK